MSAPARLAWIASCVALAATACGGGISGEDPATSGPLKASPTIDALGRFGPYALGMPWASVPGMDPRVAKFGAFQTLTEPLVYAGAPHAVTVFRGEKSADKVGCISLKADPPTCDAVLAQMKKDFGPPGRVRHDTVTVMGETKKVSNYAWKGKAVGATFERGALLCSASVKLLGEAPDYTGAFAD